MPESNPFQKSCAYNECSVTRKLRPIRLIGPDDITRSTLWMCYLDEKYQVKKESVFVPTKSSKDETYEERGKKRLYLLSMIFVVVWVKELL